VSAGSVTARSTLAAVCGDRVRAFQHALYRAAKADPGRRFHALFDKVHRRDVLDRAWEDVRRNRGAAGIDRVSLADVEEYGVTRLLGELAAELRERRYWPLPARRVFIPKPGTEEKRPLSIPTVTAYCAPGQTVCGSGIVRHGHAPVSSAGRAAAASAVRAEAGRRDGGQL
jgi:hypothetical protein